MDIVSGHILVGVAVSVFTPAVSGALDLGSFCVDHRKDRLGHGEPSFAILLREGFIDLRKPSIIP
ncbi:MAG: hypothetical protein DI591_09435 [Citromicrobium sp.]|nr:MAG: hypothetical protein DI591_09435 [Citromicrobium sp.]